jgi:hypothetical protein
MWQEKSAVLKIQGLKLEVEEAIILREFTLQNKSNRIRAPKVYLHEPWQEERGYGFSILEEITSPRIFQMPHANEAEMNTWCDFYQEYKTEAVLEKWIVRETTDTVQFVCARMNHWQKIAQDAKHLRLEDYAEILLEFSPIATGQFHTIPLEFCHGHLTANDVYVESTGHYVMMANLLWGWRPQWYDLAFNIWACFLHLRDLSWNFPQWIAYYQEWIKYYRRIPVVAQDNDFERKFSSVMLERTVGAILVDLGANESFHNENGVRHFQHLLSLHQKFAEYLMEKLG